MHQTIVTDLCEKKAQVLQIGQALKVRIPESASGVFSRLRDFREVKPPRYAKLASVSWVPQRSQVWRLLKSFEYCRHKSRLSEADSLTVTGWPGFFESTSTSPPRFLIAATARSCLVSSAEVAWAIHSDPALSRNMKSLIVVFPTKKADSR
jgi:hypothetical protein